MLTKEIVNDKIEILEDGTIQIREATKILEDGVVISKKFTNRRCLDPGATVDDEVQEIKDIAGIVHTPERVQKFKQKKATAEAAMNIQHGKS